MPTLDEQTTARARKNHQVILQALASVGQGPVADALKVHESTISRLKEPQEAKNRPSELEEFATLLAVCGLKPVPVTVECYEPDYIAALHVIAGIRRDKEPPRQLIW